MNRSVIHDDELANEVIIVHLNLPRTIANSFRDQIVTLQNMAISNLLRGSVLTKDRIPGNNKPTQA